jgi:hypothetical protein
MDHRTVHDLELEVRRVKLELERIVQEDGDADAYCVDIADNDPTLYCWLMVEFCPEEMQEAMLNIVRDHPELELLATYH